jgi:hypothetical protein
MPAQSDQQVVFGFFADCPVVVQQHEGQITSDAGLLPVREFDDRWKYTQRLAGCLTDLMPGREHSLLSMLRQRIFGIIAGYEDCNDHDHLRDELVFKLIADRSPDGKALASQPTLSRFENGVVPAELQKLVDFTVDTGVERLTALRAKSPHIAIHVRGDAGFGVPSMYDVCQANGLTYTVGFSSNAKLKRLTESLMAKAVGQYKQTGEKARLFECFQYKAGDWTQTRTVIAKAECHAGGTNLRFVVTNLPDVVTPEDGRRIYDDYIQRGESEHRMDELKNGLSAGRLSCHRFMANFFRLILHTAAYNLTNALRDDPGLPEIIRRGQPQTLRTQLIKVAATIVTMTRRVIVQLAGQWPWWDIYRAVAERAGRFTPPFFIPSS